MRRIFQVLFLVIIVAAVLGQATVTAQGRRIGDRRFKPRPFALTLTLANLQRQIDALRTQVTAIDVKLDVQTASISELGASVLALESRISQTDATVADIQLYQLAQDALIEQLSAQWNDAEAQLAQHAGDIQALLAADQALQALIAAVQLDVDADEALTAQLQAAVAEKQQAIGQLCPAGSAIRQITSSGGVVCETVGGGAATLLGLDVLDSFRQIQPGGTTSSQVQCPSGYTATGGGLHRDFLLDVYFDGPFGNGWQVAARNPNADVRVIRAFAKCAKVGP
jgi:hypothetical protein